MQLNENQKDYKEFRVGNYVVLGQHKGIVYDIRNNNVIVRNTYTGDEEITGDFKGLSFVDNILNGHFKQIESKGSFWVGNYNNREMLSLDFNDPEKIILYLFERDVMEKAEEFEIKYFHELQNIYFEKTGRELPISL